MSFWRGFAQAVREADERRFKEKMVAEEREYASGVREEDREFRREMFLEQLNASRADATTAYERQIALAERENQMAIERSILGQLGFGSTKTSGSKGGGGGSGGGLPEGQSIEAMLRQASEYDIKPEYLAELAGSPTALKTFLDEMEKRREETEDKRGMVFNAEDVVIDIINTNRNLEDVSEEEIQEVFDRYSPHLGDVELTDTIGATDITWEDLIRGKLAEGEITPIFSNPEYPQTQEDLSRTITEMSEGVVGYLETELQTLRAIQSDLATRRKSGETVDDTEVLNQISTIQSMQKAAENGNFSALYSNPEYLPYLGGLLHTMKSRYNNFDPKRVDPNLPNVYLTGEDYLAARESGEIDFGDIVVVEGEVFKIDNPLDIPQVTTGTLPPLGVKQPEEILDEAQPLVSRRKGRK